jgi:hypothetical protein
MHTPSKATFYSGSVSNNYTVGKYSGEIVEKLNNALLIYLKRDIVAVAFC